MSFVSNEKKNVLTKFGRKKSHVSTQKFTSSNPKFNMTKIKHNKDYKLMENSNSNLANSIMNEMIQTNEPNDLQNNIGSPPQQKEQPTTKEELQQTFVNIIRNDKELSELMNSNGAISEIINKILNNEELLSNLVANPQIIPDAIKSFLAESEGEQLEAGTAEELPEEMPDNIDYDEKSAMLYEQKATDAKKRDVKQTLSSPFSLNLSDFIGPLLSIVLYVVFTKTPVMYYLSNIKYIGGVISSNMFVFTLLFIGISHFALGKLYDVIAYLV
jgi:hypothetical protein